MTDFQELYTFVPYILFGSHISCSVRLKSQIDWRLICEERICVKHIDNMATCRCLISKSHPTYIFAGMIFCCWNPFLQANVVENKNHPDMLLFRIRGTLLKVNGCHCSTVFLHYSNAKQVNFNQCSAPHRYLMPHFLNMFIRLLMYY